MDYYRRTRVGGSSPRVRGKRVIPFGFCGGGRIIPARAGQTNPRRPVHGQNPDHPRACGANLNLPPYIDERYGSSPRVRGKLVRLLALRRSPRIIPARAGQTIISWLVATGSADHPRACGANFHNVLRRNGTPGSSPRVRGKLVLQPLTQLIGRIIPARAGQTFGFSVVQ